MNIYNNTMQTNPVSLNSLNVQCRRMGDTVSLRQDSATVSDETLATRAQSGNQAAWTELDRRWRSKMMGLATRNIGAMDEAQDIVQQAFFAAYKSLDRFRQEAKFGSWLHKITLNKCLDWRRSQKRTREIGLGTRLLTDSESATTTAIGDSGTECELRDAIRKAMASLSACERRTVELALRWGYTRRQIAERLGWPIGTVSTRLARARKRLGEQLVRFK